MTKQKNPPFDWAGSKAEWAIHEALTELGEDFEYQSPYAKTMAELGGALIDFYLRGRNLVINIATPTAQLSEHMLSSWSVKMALIDEGDALSDPMYFVKKVLDEA